MAFLSTMQITRQWSPSRTSARGDLKRLLSSITAESLKKTHASLLCPEHGVRRVVQVFTASRTCQLACDCRRTLANLGCEQLLKQQVWKIERQIEREKGEA